MTTEKISPGPSDHEIDDLTPLEFMLGVMRDGAAAKADRKWAAEKAAPYCHPKMSTVDSAPPQSTPRQEDALKELA